MNIDFQQILLHLFNFSILSFGLYLLLFKPVQSFMEKREHTYLDMHHKAETELKEAEELKAAYEKHLETVEAEVEEYGADEQDQFPSHHVFCHGEVIDQF